MPVPLEGAGPSAPLFLFQWFIRPRGRPEVVPPGSGAAHSIGAVVRDQDGALAINDSG